MDRLNIFVYTSRDDLERSSIVSVIRVLITMDLFDNIFYLQSLLYLYFNIPNIVSIGLLLGLYGGV